MSYALTAAFPNRRETTLRLRLLVAGAGCVLAVFAVRCEGQVGGVAKSFSARLATRLDIDWQGGSLRDRLAGLGRQQGVVVFLDRRIDPDQSIEFRQGTPVPLGRLLEAIGREIGAVPVPIGEVIYLAPRESASAIVGQMRELQQACRAAWPIAARKRLSLAWSTGARPRGLVVRAAKSFGLSIANPQSIPHDVWPACDLPPLRPHELFTLLLCGFDLGAVPNSSDSLSVVPLAIRDEFPTTPLFVPRKSPALVDLRKRFSGLRWERRGAWFYVSGEWQQIDAAFRLFLELDEQHGHVDSADPPEQLYTLAVSQQPVGALLKTLQDKGFQIQVEQEVRGQLAKRVTFEVNRVSLKMLLERALTPVGLRFELEGNTIRVSRVEE